MFILFSTLAFLITIIGKRYPRLLELTASFQYLIQASLLHWIYNAYLFLWDIASQGERPARAGDRVISAKWLNKLMHKKNLIPNDLNVVDVKIEDLTNHRGLVSVINVLRLTYDKESKSALTTIIMKTYNSDTISARYTNIAGSRYREAIFYENFRNISVKPNIYYAYGSPYTGNCIIFMEDLRSKATGINFYFGNQVWGTKELDKPREPKLMLEDIFIKAAEMHATYWNDKELMKNKWLKGVAWYAGKDQATWSMGLKTGRNMWNKSKLKMKDDGVKWSSKLISIIDKSYENSSWEKVQEQLSDSKIPFTLTHGDFHASNMLYLSSTNEVVWVDWPEVGIWEPMVDIGQTMISDIKLDVRREHERDLVKTYWDNLISRGVSPTEYTFQQCWKSYQRSPIERWIWMFSILTNFGLPANAMQYFHDQLLAFIEDHSDEPYYIIRPIACFTTL